MKYNKYTGWFAIVMLALYSLYAFFSLGIIGILLSAAVGLIAASFFDDIETITIFVILFGVFYSMHTRLQMQQYQPVARKEGFTDGTPAEITSRIESIEKGSNKGPTGVYSSFVEGFESTQASSMTPPDDGASSTSQPASSKRADEIKSPLVEVATTADIDKKDDKKSTESFQSASTGLFKLGEVPSESKDGPQLDAGATFMKAIGALNPEQITSMTQDTQKLLETQKSLITMLHGMSPILKDGKQLLDTFSGMFGGTAGGTGGVKQTAGLQGILAQ
jgi:hypothetical protein